LTNARIQIRMAAIWTIAEITRHGFIVAGRQPSRVLEFIEAALDAVAQGIDVAIDRDLNLAVPARGNDRRGTFSSTVSRI